MATLINCMDCNNTECPSHEYDVMSYCAGFNKAKFQKVVKKKLGDKKPFNLIKKEK